MKRMLSGVLAMVMACLLFTGWSVATAEEVDYVALAQADTNFNATGYPIVS